MGRRRDRIGRRRDGGRRDRMGRRREGRRMDRMGRRRERTEREGRKRERTGREGRRRRAGERRGGDFANFNIDDLSLCVCVSVCPSQVIPQKLLKSSSSSNLIQ